MLKLALNIQFVSNPMRTLLIAFLMTLATQAGANEAEAHIKCFANLSVHLFTVEMRDEKKELERKRQRHLELAVQAGRKRFKRYNDDKFGIDFFLGGYVERVFSGQKAKLYCDDPNNYTGYCQTWVSYETDILSKIGMKFYERENCALILN